VTNPYDSPYAYTPPPPPDGATPQNPGLWLGLSIASTLLCCMPLGVVGIVFAAQAMGAHSRGDYYETAEKISKAKAFTFWSVGIGLLGIVCAVGANINQMS
jgi:hypothetical protein